MEMLVALAVFGVLMMVILPVLGQAGRNLAFAQSAYRAHLAAQSIMLAQRDSFDGNQTAADLGVTHFEILTHSVDPQFFELHGFPFVPGAEVIVVIVYDENGRIAGRAIGVRQPPP